MSICACYESVKEKWNALTDAKDKWIGRKVEWLLGDNQYRESTKYLVDSLFYSLGVLSIATAAIAGIYRDSTPYDTKVMITIGVSAAFATAVIGSIFNGVIFRYQPHPPVDVSRYIRLAHG